MNDLMKEKLEKLKVIVSEVDGIVTEHLSAIDPMGYVIFKQYYMKDFEAVNELKKTFTFVFLSSDDAVNYKVCRDRNIPFFHNKRNKKEELIKIMRRYEVTPEEVLYIGSTFSDLECIQLIPFSMCPSDSIDPVQRVVTHTLSIPSGIGVICEVYNMLSEEIARRKRME
jgi:3-deoxy-D-manno-octulosonate 8-phosphate phosphatase KdsC-like HAD superfamily phosphatase